jgi:hypothetical protein
MWICECFMVTDYPEYDDLPKFWVDNIQEEKEENL